MQMKDICNCYNTARIRHAIVPSISYANVKALVIFLLKVVWSPIGFRLCLEIIMYYVKLYVMMCN